MEIGTWLASLSPSQEQWTDVFVFNETLDTADLLE
jgi:hypothetical protein